METIKLVNYFGQKSEPKLSDFSDRILQARNNWIILSRLADEKEEQIGSIAIRKSEEESKQNMGVVVSVGKDVDENVKPGDLVIWGDWTLNTFYWNKRPYIAIRSTDMVMSG
jgi:co-chaperonin GroES (HSP10)